MQQLAVKIIFAGYHTSPLKSCNPKFEPQEGCYLVTSSYDMTAKVWSGRYFKPVKTLSAHEAKVTSLNINACNFPNLDKCYIPKVLIILPLRMNYLSFVCFTLFKP
ncbi:hypothetical protein Peur_070701 [Populus x canadensis]